MWFSDPGFSARSTASCSTGTGRQPAADHLSNALTNLNLTDMETCYKAFRTDVIKNLNLKSDRFGFEPEVTAKVAKSPCVVYEVPISYHGRTYSQGKKITWRDGAAAVVHIVLYNMFRSPEQCRRRPWAEVPGLVEQQGGRDARDLEHDPALARRS